VNFHHLATKKIIPGKTHTNNFCEKKVLKLPRFEGKNHEIVLGNQDSKLFNVRITWGHLPSQGASFHVEKVPSTKKSCQ
jgi:hypothetical protein